MKDSSVKDAVKDAVIDAVIDISSTVVFALASIVGGYFLIDHSTAVVLVEHKTLLGKGGHLLAWAGALSVVLTIFGYVLWPWFSIKQMWVQHKDDPTFAAAFTLGWCIIIGLFIHAVFWSAT